MVEQEKNGKEQQGIHKSPGFGYLLNLTFRLRYWILACVTVLALAVFVWLRFTPRVYERTIVLQVNMDNCEICPDSLMEGVQENEERIVHDRMEAKVLLLQSEPVMRHALSSLAKQSGDAHPLAVELYSRNKSNLSAQYSKYSNVIRLSFRSPDQQQADAILLCLVDSFNEIVSPEEVYDHAYLTVIDPPRGSDVPVYPHPKLLYLLAVVLGLFIPMVVYEIKELWKDVHK